MRRLDMTTIGWKLFVPAALAGAAYASPAHADDSCSLRGDAILAKGVAIYDAPAGGTEIATFTGATVGLTIHSLPESSGGRAAVSTSGFRLKGFVRAKDISVYASRSVPVYAGHVWIAEARKVSVLGASGGRLHVEKTLSFPMTGYFHGWAPCEAFTLSARVPSGWTPAGGMRGYVVKKARVDLYADPRGDVVTSLEPSSDGEGILLWSMERQGAWIHVEHHGDVVLDGWVRAQDVSTLPPGETMDQQLPATTQPGSPSLQVQGNTKSVTAARDVLLRSAASDAGAVIGAIETGTTVLVLDVVAGWASVVPKNLAVTPAGNNQFWARAKDLGI